MRSARRVLLIAAVVAFVGGACTSDGSKSASSSKSETTTAAALEAAARSYTEAFLDKDTDAAFARLSKACQTKHGKSGTAAMIQLAAQFLEGFSGKKLSEISVGEVTSRKVTKTTGDVRIELVADGKPLPGFNDEDSFDPYIYENGSWRATKCEDFESESDAAG